MASLMQSLQSSKLLTIVFQSLLKFSVNQFLKKTNSEFKFKDFVFKSLSSKRDEHSCTDLSLLSQVFF